MSAQNQIIAAAVLQLVRQGYSADMAEHIVHQNVSDGYTTLHALTFVEPSVEPYLKQESGR